MTIPIKVLALVSAAATTSVALTSLPAWGDESSPAPYSEAATEAPAVEEPVQVLDGVTLNASIWENFQNSVQACMEAHGWQYAKPPVPSWWEPLYDEYGEPVGEEPPFREPAPLNTHPSPVDPGGVPSTPFLVALRGTSTTAEDNGVREYIGHDGINSPFFGALPEETRGCEAAARAAVTIPAIEAKNALQGEVAEEVASEVNPDELVSFDDVAEELSELSPAEEAVFLEDNAETIDQAGGNSAE